MSANDDLRARHVRHAVWLERVKTGEVRRVTHLLNKYVLRDIEKRIDKITSMGIAAEGRKKARKLIKTLVNDGMGKMSKELAEAVQNMARAESAFETRLLNELTPVGVSFDTPNRALLRTLTLDNPFEGHTLKEWTDSLSLSAQDAVYREVQIGLAQGEDVPTIATRLRGTAGAGFTNGTFAAIQRQAEAVARTAINHASTVAREATYMENEDVVKGVQYVATLDSRTTDICAGLDGQVFDVGDGPRPPMHFGCRSTTTPVLKSWKELGIDLKEAPEGTRASLSGQVPEKQTYGQWLKQQPLKVQREVLGKTKAELFNRGLVKIDKFTDARHKPMTIKQILRKEGIKQDEVMSLRKQDVA